MSSLTSRVAVFLSVIAALAAPSPAAAGRRCGSLCRAPIALCRMDCTQSQRRARKACRATCRRSLLAFCRTSPAPTCTLPDPCAAGACTGTTPWVSAYYTGYDQDLMPPAEIEFASLTHLMHFGAVPRSDGTLDTDSNSLTVEHSSAAVAAAHAAGRSVLVTLGGADSGPAFGAALRDHRAALVANAVSLVVERGYDGLDLDMEPIAPADFPNYGAFVRELRAALNAARGGLLLTAAVQPDARDVFAQLADAFDQVNLMTYNLSGPYPGWVTWHDAPLFDGGHTFESTGEPLPSADAMVRDFVGAGLPAARLGIGVISEVAVWHGATGPLQPIDGVTLEYRAYRDVLATLWAPDRERTDDGAGADYLSIDLPGTADDLFVSWEDEAACARKAAYVRANGIGGVILWDLGNAFLPDRPAGARNPLLHALGAAFAAE